MRNISLPICIGHVGMIPGGRKRGLGHARLDVADARVDRRALRVATAHLPVSRPLQTLLVGRARLDEAGLEGSVPSSPPYM